MKRKYYRLQSQAARWSLRFGWLGLICLAGGIVLHRFGWTATSDLAFFALFATMIALAALALAAKGFSALWRHGHKGGMSAFKGMLLAVVTLVPPVFAAAAWVVFPPLNEISTDLETPPAFLPGVRPADALPVSDDLAVQAEEQLAAWPQLGSRRYDGSPDSILRAVLSVLRAKGWIIAGQGGETGEDTELLVQAVAKTWVMGFVSDIAIRLVDEGDTTFVDIRAASRYLQRDFGTNARFITGFMDALDSEVLLTPVDHTQE